VLGHPLAYIATIAILLALFGWTFIEHPERTAPTRDPAFYTWRTEAFISEEPEVLVQETGPLGLFSGGYRVSAPVISSFITRLGDTGPASAIALIMVGLPVAASALLGGLAFRYRRDPLLWHVVTIASAGLMLSRPFLGYLDNVLCVFFLTASLWFYEPARTSMRARMGFGLFLVLAGLTHPTTLSIFGLTLGAMTAAYFLFMRGSLKEKLRAALNRDLPGLVTALIAAVVVYAIWTIGIWGESVSLSESALLFPYSKDFFLGRLDQWVTEIRPVLNGPLLVIGAVGLLAAGRRWVEDDLARSSIVWTAPLVGTFGFLFGLTYPYYRFFNTTFAWVMLIGLGAYFVIRFFIARSATGGINRLALIGVAAIAFILVTNLYNGFHVTKWNVPSKGWLPPQVRTDLDALRRAMEENVDPSRPVVFVMDEETTPTLAQIWGKTQLYGNTSRYGVPRGHLDRVFIYQGSLQNFLDGRPTITGDSGYDRLARASSEDTQQGTQETGEQPVVVVAQIFNLSRSNAEIATGDEPVPTTGTEVWVLNEGRITRWENGASTELQVPSPPETDEGGLLHVLRVIGAIAIMLLPGFLALRWFLPDADYAASAGIAVAMSLGAVVLLGTVGIAVTRSAFSEGLAWVVVAVAVIAALGLMMRPARGRPAEMPAS